MRICVVTTAAHGVGGKQRHTHDLVQGLVRFGHDVEVITAAHDSIAPDLYGAHWRLLDARGRFNSTRWQQASHEEFLRAHRERPFDVVHSEGSSTLGLLRAGDHRLAPIAVQFHGNYLGLLKAAAKRTIMRPRTLIREARAVGSLSKRHFTRGNVVGFRKCEAIVVSRQQLRETCRSHFLDPRRVHVVPNGVDPDFWKPVQRNGRAGSTLVAVGRLNREKGFDLAIRAVARIPGVTLKIAGDGAERQNLEGLAARLDLRDRVEFLGARAPDEVAQLVANADVFLFPTLRAEAAPMVLPEAMACGVSVVASRIGGVTEVISRPGENGVLVAPGDLDALVEAVRLLLADSPRRKAIGRAARARILEDYTVDRMIERTVEVYEVARSRARASSGAIAAAR